MSGERKCTLTWPEFEKEAQEFLKLAENHSDPWTWQTQIINDESQGYLRFHQKIHDPRKKKKKEEETIINAEYHIVYSISYQVPVLFLQLNYSDGRLLSLEEAWELFPLLLSSSSLSEEEEDNESKRREFLLGTLTQMDHPFLFRPFLCLHPCRTADLLAQIGDGSGSGTGSGSRNRILTFISLMGPYVRLVLQPSYGLQLPPE